jgi:hypothetical protein
MRDAPYRHIGGAIVADHGPLTLMGARRLAQFYLAEARRSAENRWVRVCAGRAAALEGAIIAAELWRRAAGWTLPDDADAMPKLR